MNKYIKGEIRTAIKNANSIFLYGRGSSFVALHSKKGQDWSNFIKEGLKTKEFYKVVLYHKNGGRTEIEVNN